MYMGTILIGGNRGTCTWNWNTNPWAIVQFDSKYASSEHLQALVVVVATEYTGRVSEWFIFNAKRPDFKLHHGEMVQADVYCFMLK